MNHPMQKTPPNFARTFVLPTCVLIAAICASNTIFAHGLMVEPASRNALCGLIEKPDQASSQHCKDAFANDPNGGYSFMSVLTHNVGRKGVTPLPKNVCGFDSETWRGGATPWDKATHWPAQPAKAGAKDIVWNISWGPHFDDTEEFRYWITKPNFVYDANKPLAWTDFEEQAFCALNYDDKNPNANPHVVPNKINATFKTTCTLPSRVGRHVVYGEWGRNLYTYERFHGCIDMSFSAGPTPPVAHPQSISLDKNTNVAITLSASDADGQVVSYHIATAPKNGTLTGTGASRLYTPNAEFVGSDSFSFTAKDNDNLTSAPAQVSINVKGANRAPVAKISNSISGLVLTANGHGSTDPDGDALTYAWQFGDGKTASAPHVTHNYATAGTYLVVLTVSDGKLSSSAQAQVIANPSTSLVQCDYVLENEWNSGAVAAIRVTNKGSTPINNWSVRWTYSKGNLVDHSWNAKVTGANPYQADALSWNNVIAAGQTVSFGLHIKKPLNTAAEIPSFTGGICPP